ncbi:MAG: helix-turn-helix transcriptional regulator [Clostridia bacterium]|nr:helix-turn-helix transcriptional regulator [Clostridia bacterium]
MFGKRLKELRQLKCLTQAELAGLLGISSSSVGMYEQGRREPDIALINKICEVFSVTSDYLLGMTSRSSSIEIGQILGDMKARMMASEGLMFNGVPLSEEDVTKLMDAIELSTAIVLSKKNDE